jgi:hypothetical protein
MVLVLILALLLIATPAWSATCGVTADNSTSASSSSDRKAVSSCVAGSTGTVSSMTFRVWVSSGTAQIRGIIYSNVAGQPSALLAVTDNGIISNTAEAAVTLVFSGANLITLSDGTTYWVGFHTEDPGVPTHNWSTDATASGQVRQVETWSDGTNDPWGTVTFVTGILDAYVTFALGNPSGRSLLGVGP